MDFRKRVTDGRTDRPTDRPSYKDARTHLMTEDIDADKVDDKHDADGRNDEIVKIDNRDKT